MKRPDISQRSDGADPAIYEIEGFRLDPQRRELSHGGSGPIALRGKAFDTLLYLVEHAGQAVEKSALLAAVWPNVVVEDNSLNQTISALRGALGDDAHSPRFIATLTGRGYQFIGRVTRAPAGSVGLHAKPSLPAPAPRKAVIAYAAAAIVLAAVAAWATREAFDGSEVPTSEPAAQVLAQGVLLSSSAGSHRQPTLSPDGTMIAFTSDDSGTNQIWIKNIAGGDARPLTQGAEIASWPAWSPRGDQILFQRPSLGGFSIWSIDPLGTREPRMLVERGATPNFSPDGTTFVYQGPGREIWIAKSDGSEAAKVDGVPGGPGFSLRLPAFSADGGSIVFVHAEEGPYGDVWVLPLAGGEARRLTFQGGIDLTTGAPLATPDGFVIFAAAPGTLRHGPQLWRVPIEGGPVEQLTSGVGGYMAPAMSRDGTRVVYAHSRSTWRLMRTDLQTLASTPIFESRTPILLPVVSYDGRTVAFFSETPSGVHVFTIDLDGTNLRQRTFDEGGMNTLPAWSHDGSLYYYRQRSLYRLPGVEGRGAEVLPEFHWSSRNFLSVHVDKIAYHEFPTPEDRRGVIRDLVSGRETILPAPVVRPMQWSKDGDALLGFRDDATLVVCDAAGADCETLANNEGPIRGGRPRWSLDEARIFFRRAAGRPLYSALWAVDRDGDNVTRLFEFGPFDPDNVYYGVGADDTIVWNQFEQTPSEIWIADIR